MPDLVNASSVTGDEWTDIGELFDLLRRRPAFHADAACREAPPEVSWFIVRGGDPGPAKAVCQRCLVVDECRAWALDQGAELRRCLGRSQPDGETYGAHGRPRTRARAGPPRAPRS